MTLLAGRSVVEGVEDVPRYRRELYAVASYTAGRIGELRAFAPEDVDLDAMQITIAKQADRLGTTKGKTKTRRARVVRIEPSLLPLLEILVARKGKTLLDIHNEDHARLLREDLVTVGLKRPALFADDDLRAPRPSTACGTRAFRTWPSGATLRRTSSGGRVTRRR